MMVSDLEANVGVNADANPEIDLVTGAAFRGWASGLAE
jgi:hypothetical protein